MIWSAKERPRPDAIGAVSSWAPDIILCIRGRGMILTLKLARYSAEQHTAIPIHYLKPVVSTLAVTTSSTNLDPHVVSARSQKFQMGFLGQMISKPDENVRETIDRPRYNIGSGNL